MRLFLSASEVSKDGGRISINLKDLKNFCVIGIENGHIYNNKDDTMYIVDIVYTTIYNVEER